MPIRSTLQRSAVKIAIYVAFCCIIMSLGIGIVNMYARDSGKDDPLLPPPRPVKPGEEKPGVPVEIPKQECVSTEEGTLNCVYTLPDFDEGEFNNSNIKSFSEGVAEKIHDYEQKGGRGSVREIFVVGVADGLHNNGRKNWSEVPEQCQRFTKGPLLDDGLAYVRGCLVKRKMLDSLEQAFLIKYIELEEDRPFDVPDGEASGPEIRRVEVHFRVAGAQK